MTRVRPGIRRAGSLKPILMPKCGGIEQKTSRPERIASTMSSWPCLKESMPKCWRKREVR